MASLKSTTKRGFDIAIALLALVPMIVIVTFCILLIRRGSSGPGVFRQIRVGRDGLPFICLKLRTMFVDTREAPSHETGASAVTPVGKVLRHYKLDELPQIWNVLIGDMSFVGPRPCLPSQIELIAARRANGTLSLRPGITGVAQVQGIDMSDPVALALEDSKYLGRISLGYDLKLIIATVLGSGKGDRVSQ